MKINTDDKQKFQNNGYLIIKNAFSYKDIEEAINSFNEVVTRFSQECNIEYNNYVKEISQFRDLWKHSLFYKNLLFESCLPSIASQLMDEKSARLLHDHIITKPIMESDEVPWHQDYPYWPVDNPNGLSLWLAFDDLDENSGVLEVIPESHRQGEHAPVDFIRNPRKDLDKIDKEILVVNKGDIVILHSLTWHKTSANTSVPNRRAYITLWIPPHSRYAPIHANWHPVNYNITVKEGELLNEDWFPVIGEFSRKELEQKESHSLKHFGPEVEDEELSMFNASQLIKKYLSQYYQKSDIWEHLLDKDNRTTFSKNLQRSSSCKGSVDEIENCLKSLAINSVAYKKHKARNVYNHSYVKFKSLFLD